MVEMGLELLDPLLELQELPPEPCGALDNMLEIKLAASEVLPDCKSLSTLFRRFSSGLDCLDLPLEVESVAG